MRRAFAMGAASALALCLSGCAAPAATSSASPPAQTAPAPPPSTVAPAPTPISKEAPPAPRAPEQPLTWIGPTTCDGAFLQGGLVVCRTALGAQVEVAGGRSVVADDDGFVVIGIGRDVTGPLRVTFRAMPAHGGKVETQTWVVKARQWSVQSVSGLPPSTVRPPDDPALQARLAREREAKNAGSASRAPIAGFMDGFVWPVTGGRQSGAWGNQRVLNGDPRPPHMGLDIAAPAGTPIRAPAAGVVALASPDMHFDGGLVFIDHGQGVITQYLHMSRLDVKIGDRVAQGQVIGAVGATGRATGPHLCWRMRVREVQVDPGQAVVALSKARLSLAGAAPPEAGAAPAGWTAER